MIGRNSQQKRKKVGNQKHEECLFVSVSVGPPKWNDQKKSDGTIIEENAQKVRNTCNSWRNVISTEGFSEGVHSWIVEFEGDSSGWYEFMIVCHNWNKH